MEKFCLIACFVTCCLIKINHSNEIVWKTPFQEGQAHLKNNQPQKAVESFLQAFSNGSNKDSVYYFLSEAMIYKNVYDTALAFNLAITIPEEFEFKKHTLRQRYKIYLSLKLFEDAEKTYDSLASLERGLKSWVPAFRASFSSGYVKEDERTQKNFPFPGNMRSSNFRDKGTNNIARLKA